MIKQLIPSDYCLKCFGCCRFNQQDSIWSPKLLKEEAALKDKVQLMQSKEDNFNCASLNTADNRCKIYESRPFECQLYPFLINQKGSKIFLAAHLKCPFVKDNLESESFKLYVDYLLALFSQEQEIARLKNNPQLIQSYTQVLDLAELII